LLGVLTVITLPAFSLSPTCNRHTTKL
jgi:hypothetical protein